MLICDNCKKEIIADNTNGLHNGVGFELENGKIIILCQNCLKELGRFNKAGRDAVIDRICANANINQESEGENESK